MLDVACGHGRTTRYLADRGARATGLDVSAKLIAHAERAEAREPRGIHYVVGDATTTGWWDGVVFDGVLCNLALMDIDGLDDALRTIASVLGPRGWFTFSLFHPCYPGGWRDRRPVMRAGRLPAATHPKAGG